MLYLIVCIINFLALNMYVYNIYHLIEMFV